MEVIAAATLLGVVLLIAVPSLRWVAAGRRDAAHRQLAAQEIANVMERVMAREWKDISTDAVAGEELSGEARDRLPGSVLRVEVADSSESPRAKRVTVELRWNDTSGQRLPPARLVAWKSEREGRSE
jgi:Tfp pilus assembly protein PilE